MHVSLDVVRKWITISICTQLFCLPCCQLVCLLYDMMWFLNCDLFAKSSIYSIVLCFHIRNIIVSQTASDMHLACAENDVAKLKNILSRPPEPIETQNPEPFNGYILITPRNVWSSFAHILPTRVQRWLDCLLH